MTNNEIITGRAFALMEAGTINGSGRYAETIGGESIELPEAIHTFQGWKRLGYSVKKGEHAIDKFNIWKPVTRREADESDPTDGDTVTNQRMIMVKACFFAAHQVQPIKQ